MHNTGVNTAVAFQTRCPACNPSRTAHKCAALLPVCKWSHPVPQPVRRQHRGGTEVPFASSLTTRSPTTLLPNCYFTAPPSTHCNEPLPAGQLPWRLACRTDACLPVAAGVTAQSIHAAGECRKSQPQQCLHWACTGTLGWRCDAIPFCIGDAGEATHHLPQQLELSAVRCVPAWGTVFEARIPTPAVAPTRLASA